MRTKFEIGEKVYLGYTNTNGDPIIKCFNIKGIEITETHVYYRSTSAANPIYDEKLCFKSREEVNNCLINAAACNFSVFCERVRYAVPSN